MHAQSSMSDVSGSPKMYKLKQEYTCLATIKLQIGYFQLFIDVCNPAVDLFEVCNTICDNLCLQTQAALPNQ